MTVTIGCLAAGEARVALTPEVAGRLRATGLDVVVEAGAGAGAWFGDEEYVAAGAEIVSRAEVYARAGVLAVIGRPLDCERLRPGQVLIGLLSPADEPDELAAVTALSFEGLPRTISSAQSMDVLTSQANVAGYKAAVLAADSFGGFFPMMMTAAGTVRPAKVLVLGGGVAGLQAMATARRLGALVSGYDVRPAALADIASTGASVLDLGISAEGSGGYARELSGAERAAQEAAMVAALHGFDVVITTAQVPGRRPPMLVTAEGLAAMAPGSVVVDLAAGPYGGNVAGSVADDRRRTANGVLVIGAGNLPAQLPRAASSAWARNVGALLGHVIQDGSVVLDPGDAIVAGLLVRPKEAVS
ncbi:NAD(P)(+) transhydrogenase (Re/Si-specific) subunit alpha [Kribbella sp. NPDC020789]